jgi:hypothetical protein
MNLVSMSESNPIEAWTNTVTPIPKATACGCGMSKVFAPSSPLWCSPLCRNPLTRAP